MDVATPQSDLYSKLLQIGWTLQKIDFKQGVYVAKAENETTGQEIERIGQSPEMALAAVLRFAQGAYEIRRMAALSKLAAWDGDFLGQGQEIGQAYSKMPPFDEKAVPAWKALAAESKIQADAIKRQITVEIVDDPDPYQSAEEMQNDVHKNRHLSVSRADSQHPVWSAEDVVNFRIVNDVIGHAQSGADFSWTGENKAFAVHAPLLSPMAREALFTETVGRAAYDKSFRGSGSHKIGFLSQFLHPMQERQGEHVWIPHGGLPDLAPSPPMQQPSADAMFEQPGGWQYASPAFERDPAVMEGYKPKKISFGWNEQPQEQQQPEWATHIPCPTNIPIRPEREIECPDWEPTEQPLTVPEEWPEEAPSPAPEREKEPAVAHRVSNEDLPLHYSQEAGVGWKILLGMEDGSLRSPSQDTTWPVGQPLVAEGDPNDFRRGNVGIHLVPEGDWSELYSYSDRPNAILVKCKLYGKYYEGSTEHGKGILATKAMPVLAVGRDQELLLRIANKYGIDTETPQANEADEGGGVVVFQAEDGWKIVDPNGVTEDHPLNKPSYKNFTFDRPKGTSSTGDVVYNIVDPDNQPQGFIEMRIAEDYYGKMSDCVVEKVQIPDETDEAIALVREFFTNLPVYAEYDRSSAWEHSDWEYEMSDYRDSETVSDAAGLIGLINGNSASRYGYTLDQMSYDGWNYEWDDSDVRYDLGEPDQYGVRPYEITVSEDAPPDLDFDPNTWQDIFREELETLQDGWQEPDSAALAQALVQVPQFILTENAQSNTSSFKEWEQVGGLAFIRQQINEARFQMGQRGEHAPLEVTDWLYQIESTLAGSQVPDANQQQVVQPIETWQKSDANEPDWKPWQQIHPDQEQIPGTFGKVASRDPDYLFVYYKSELRVKKWEHDLRQADMLEQLLDEFDVDMGNTGLDIDPAEVAAGEIFTFPDGEYRVEHKQLSDPEVREHAEDLLDDWLGEWRSLNQARDPQSGQFV